MQRIDIRVLAGAIALLAGLLPPAFSGPADARAVFTPVDVPGATGTQPEGINAAGTVAGVYTDDHYVGHCFVWTTGTVSYCDPEGSTFTFVAGINDSGTVAGTWRDGSFMDHGFLYAADGTITVFDPKGSTRTTAYGIDANGDVTGEYLDSSNVPHGFIRAGSSGKIVSFDVPGADATIPQGINDSKTVVGFYGVGDYTQGFVRTADGTVTTIASGDAVSFYAIFINDGGVIAGEYEDKDNSDKTFTRDAAGNMTYFTVDNEVPAVSGLNSNGDVCGAYDRLNINRKLRLASYIRAADGKITTYFYPLSNKYAECAGINAVGATTGTYRLIKKGADHGYIRTP